MKRTFKEWTYKLQPPPGRESTRLPSLETPGGSTSPKETLQYTGDNVLGISLIHKSGFQPIFNKQAAIDAANMRR